MDTKFYVPPNWTGVKIIKNPNSKYYAIGYDSKGREQRLYNQKWIDYASTEKFKRVKEFEHKYRKFKNILNKFIALDALSKDCVIAYMCLIMENLNIRIGNDIYLSENGSYGLTTLNKKNFKKRNNEYIIEFVGKRGIKHVKIISDIKILSFLKRIIKSNNLDYLFCYKNERGIFKNVTSSDLNSFIKFHLGNEFSSKDIRTYSANKILLAKLKKLSYSNETERKKNIQMAIVETAEKLGNTPSVCRKYYIDPTNITNY